MSAYAIFDVDIRDMTKYQEFMAGVKPALATARYRVRQGAFWRLREDVRSLWQMPEVYVQTSEAKLHHMGYD
jgi:uncharacterized protein (DUF1330 family)